MIGGYAQFTWGFNYWGPTGNNRDSCIVVRKRRGAEVRRLMERPRAGGDGVPPRQVHRLPHLLGRLQERLDRPARAPSTRGGTTSRRSPARGYPGDWEDQERWKGGWELDGDGPAAS